MPPDPIADMVQRVTTEKTHKPVTVPAGAALGQWAEAEILGVKRLVHYEIVSDGLGDRLYRVTVYKGDQEKDQMLSAAFWRGVSDHSFERASAALSELIASQPE